MRAAELSGNLYDDGTGEISTRVDFDIAVTGETEGSGEAGVKVVWAGLSGKIGRKSGHESRISFSVPVRLPMGDDTLANEQDTAAKIANASRKEPTGDFY